MIQLFLDLYSPSPWSYHSDNTGYSPVRTSLLRRCCLGTVANAKSDGNVDEIPRFLNEFQRSLGLGNMPVHPPTVPIAHLGDSAHDDEIPRYIHVQPQRHGVQWAEVMVHMTRAVRVNTAWM